MAQSSVGNGGRFNATTAQNAVAVVPSDATILAGCVELIIGGAGNLVVDTAGGQTNITLAVVAGERVPIAALKVKAATTATGIVAVY